MRATTCSIGKVFGLSIVFYLTIPVTAQTVEPPATAPAVQPTTEPVTHAWDSSDPNVRAIYLPAWDIAFSGDGGRLAVAGESIIQLDIATGRELWQMDVGKWSYGRRIAFSPDGKRLAVSHLTGISILDANTGVFSLKLQREYPANEKFPEELQYMGMTPVSFSPDGNTIASSAILGSQGEIDLWDANTGQLLRTLAGFNDKMAHNVFDVAFSPDGRSIAGVDGAFSQNRAGKLGGQLRVWDVATGTLVRTYGAAVYCSWSVAFSPDGKLLATGSGLYGRHDVPRGEVRVWDVSTGRAVYTGNRQECVYRVLFSPDSRRLISGGGGRTSSDSELVVTDTSTWVDEAPLTGRWGVIEGIAFSRDGRLLASASSRARAGSLRLWNMPPVIPVTKPAADIKLFINQLADTDFHVRRNAVRQLKALGKAARPALREARTSGDPEVQARVDEILGDYTPPYANAILHTIGVVAYWRFNGPAPRDSLVGGYTGTIINGTLNSPVGGAPTGDAIGKKALWLDGNKSRFSTNLTTQQQFNNGATFMCWVNISTPPSGAGRIFTIMTKGEVHNDLDLQAEMDGKIHFYTDIGSSTSFSPASLVGWHQIAATIDTLTQRRCIYWDGKLATEDTHAPARSPSIVPFTIGESPAFPGRYFQGAIDEVSLFNRALSPQEIDAIHAAASE